MLLQCSFACVRVRVCFLNVRKSVVMCACTLLVVYVNKNQFALLPNAREYKAVVPKGGN